jgi:hypothetical protein
LLYSANKQISKGATGMQCRAIAATNGTGATLRGSERDNIRRVDNKAASVNASFVVLVDYEDGRFTIAKSGSTWNRPIG